MAKKVSDQYPQVMKCARGEEWPAESYKTLISYTDTILTHKSISVVCPAGHKFDLERGVRDGWVTASDALKLIDAANKALPDLKIEARRITRNMKKMRDKNEKKR